MLRSIVYVFLVVLASCASDPAIEPLFERFGKDKLVFGSELTRASFHSLPPNGTEGGPCGISMTLEREQAMLKFDVL